MATLTIKEFKEKVDADFKALESRINDLEWSIKLLEAEVRRLKENMKR